MRGTVEKVLSDCRALFSIDENVLFLNYVNVLNEMCSLLIVIFKLCDLVV